MIKGCSRIATPHVKQPKPNKQLWK